MTIQRRSTRFCVYQYTFFSTKMAAEKRALSFGHVWSQSSPSLILSLEGGGQVGPVRKTPSVFTERAQTNSCHVLRAQYATLGKAGTGSHLRISLSVSISICVCLGMSMSFPAALLYLPVFPVYANIFSLTIFPFPPPFLFLFSLALFLSPPL